MSIGVYDKMLQTQYLRSYLTYEVDIWYAVPWPYVKVLINFWAESIIYYQSYAPFCGNLTKNKASYILDLESFRTLKSYMHFLYEK